MLAGPQFVPLAAPRTANDVSCYAQRLPAVWYDRLRVFPTARPPSSRETATLHPGCVAMYTPGAGGGSALMHFGRASNAEAAHPSHPHCRAPPLRATAWEGRIHGTQTGMLRGVPRSARCVQRFDDSRNSAIHITYRVSLRSSSMGEPRDPLSKVVFFFVGRYDPTH